MQLVVVVCRLGVCKKQQSTTISIIDVHIRRVTPHMHGLLAASI